MACTRPHQRRKAWCRHRAGSRLWPAFTTPTSSLLVCPHVVVSSCSILISLSGSWDGTIRFWKLDSKLKSFSLVGTTLALGVVNSLQLVPAPKGFFDEAEWASAPAVKKSAPSSVLLVAGLGQEHRFGRWLQVKDGAKNGALIVALHPTRTV